MKKLTLYRIIKVILVVIIGIWLFDGLSATRVSHTSFRTMEKTMTKYANTKQTKKGSTQIIRRLYGLDPSDYDGVLLYYPASTMSANEMLVIKLKSVKDQDNVLDSIKTRQQSQENAFKGYGATQTKLLQDGIIEVRGNYILYVVDSNASSIRDAFVNAL
jgi:hypothetical protein